MYTREERLRIGYTGKRSQRRTLRHQRFVKNRRKRIALQAFIRREAARDDALFGGKYVLARDCKTPIEEPNLGKWARFMEKQDGRRVTSSQVGSVWVSTVFLGLDSGLMFRSDPGYMPEVFETMVFPIEGNESYVRRYRTWSEAVAGHHEVVAAIERAPQ